MVGIYKITSPNGKIYIGQSINIELRFRAYLGSYVKHQTRLRRSFDKYGIENHVFEIICECLESELNEKERYYQDLYDVIKKGLNCRLTKSNDKSGSVSNDTKIKCSIGQKNVQARNKANGIKHKTMDGKKHSNETKLKMSLSHKKTNALEKANGIKRKKGKPTTGYKHSEEVREKLKLLRLGTKQLEETKVKIAEAMKGRVHSEEAKAKMSQAMKESHARRKTRTTS
jgi:group I intron endonuclease